ncbi:hypothetical protein BOTBODRAFT_254468 [Botryobasidium botryosum FD-172 SS1]|uniref:Uncharacterized protein n=1 Tax=Botryobasidium botryosum (strain FD-172 SS1) TaxID=930990 RepID=A0A067M4A5_BOTB1|nr:hypothetical protein BOTBODRAFT_254468 [Botryobasidium botryosum FD-172 SS1]
MRSVVLMVDRAPWNEKCRLSARDFHYGIGQPPARRFEFGFRYEWSRKRNSGGNRNRDGYGNRNLVRFATPRARDLSVRSLDSTGGGPMAGVPGVLSTRSFFAQILRDIPSLRSVPPDRCPTAFVDVLINGSGNNVGGTMSGSSVGMQGHACPEPPLGPLVENIELAGCNISDDALMALTVPCAPSASGEASGEGGRLHRLILKWYLVNVSIIQAMRGVMPELEIVWDALVWRWYWRGHLQ